MADGAAAEGATAPAANASNSTPPASASTGSATGTTNGSTPPIAQERPLVVPVIVVGLQSVTPADLATAIPENVRQEIENAMSGQRNGNAAASGTGQSSSAADQSGRRSRTSRVLHRLSNLPPWRTPPADPASESSALPEDSSESASLPAPERPPTPAPPSMTGGSSSSTTSPSATQPGRTFLIYVIGGYFSPQHSLVTGNLESLNSFEALWQLADLLGQVKPPVATKDDIEKNYHEVGKVKENTMERCLICLEDYEAEDDLRLLSCSHAFHQACVDQWLEQGKNNCPACRTKGVLVQSDREEAVPSSSTTESSTAAPTAAPSTT
ncbi:hypothetical protein BKA62DRAFT_768732 [Auriculariales sp. MPI-PUGE-AT-0066]|nr:hypothetical protein BKA62DRAFT_768732 [Auriculariales sp. MPI-PUGE-AT-0066]